jgi:predicted CXXCH cytochrome family protein
MKRIFTITTLFLLMISVDLLFAQSDFSTSLHAKRNGKNYWYGTANGGFETLSQVPIAQIGCKECHGPTDANGNAYTGTYAPGCSDCHKTDFSVEESQCISCHGRQATERNLGFQDVHRTANMKCWDCHTKNDMHGNGTEYNSLLEPGAIEASCENCHKEGGTGPVYDHSQVDPHGGKLTCTSCHAQTVISCYSCHFESQVNNHLKRAYKPINGFILLANRTKDGKIAPASFQSVAYQGKTFTAFAPFTPHTILKEGRKCNDCHNNAAAKEYLDSKQIIFSTWNAADSTLSWKKGIVPIPPDYATSFKMDYIAYTGNTSDPVAPSKKWQKVKDTHDGTQMMFATPLTEHQIENLATDFGTAWNNFATSLHKTRAGKDFWYGKNNGGFEGLTNIPIENLGCKDCHGPTKATGEAYMTPFEGASCYDCHDQQGNTSQDQCLSCHSRQKTEIATMQLTDVHRTANMQCWACHKSEDMHGDGTTHNSMLEPGAIKADCSNEGCHTTVPAGHESKDPHGGKLHCTSCHAQTVISCYNCHLESQLEHQKRAVKPLKDFVILVNRTKDSKIYPASFQSVTYNGNAWIAMAPFTSHSITRSGRVCADCHANFGGNIDAIKEYNQSGKITFANWNEADSTLSWKKGIIPLPSDYSVKLKMDFLTYTGNPADPVAPSKKWQKIGKDTPDGFQLLFATPLSKKQMAKLGYDTTLTNVREEVNPSQFTLEQNYPNPFNPSTTISYYLPKSSNVELKVFDALGNLVKTLVNRQQSAGKYDVRFDGSNLTSGVYFYQLTADGFKATKKLILLK